MNKLSKVSESSAKHSIQLWFLGVVSMKFYILFGWQKSIQLENDNVYTFIVLIILIFLLLFTLKYVKNYDACDFSDFCVVLYVLSTTTL